MGSLYRISQFAKITGKTTRALRFYEDLGILSPTCRTDAGYRMYGEDAVLKVEWINKLHDMGFSFPDIKNFLVSFQEIKSGPELMHTLRSLYQEKLAETNETIHRLQQLSSELQYSINYMDVCNNCEPTTSSSECKSCQKHSEDSSPLLVSIVTNAV